MHPAFWPYLIGLVPIFLARTSRARIVAILFGLLSIGCFAYYLSILKSGLDELTGTQRIRLPFVSALVIAFFSVIVTYLVDKGHDKA